MRRIHLEKVDSTNNHLRRLIDRGEAGDGLLLVDTDEQYAGRGQRGNSWESETGKNLSFSVLCHPQRIVPSRQFAISEAMALAVVETLAGLEGTTNPEKSRFSVKWPNDIYYDDKKICGTLIECDLQGKTIRNCIIGTGLNVNQTLFISDAPNPVSLCQVFGREFDRETLLEQIVNHFEKLLHQLEAGKGDMVHETYKQWLYRRTGTHAYEDAVGRFEAEIADVEPSGFLVLRDADGHLRRYEFKEVKFLV